MTDPELITMALETLRELANNPAFDDDAPEFNEGGIGHEACRQLQERLNMDDMGAVLAKRFNEIKGRKSFEPRSEGLYDGHRTNEDLVAWRFCQDQGEPEIARIKLGHFDREICDTFHKQARIEYHYRYEKVP